MDYLSQPQLMEKEKYFRDSTASQSDYEKLSRSTGDEAFINTNGLDLSKPDDFQAYLVYLLEKFLRKTPSATFGDNCLESFLDKRISSFIPDTDNNIKVLLAVSGAGKTRTLLELLSQQQGFYFVASNEDLGSRDLLDCINFCYSNAHNIELVRHAIRLLYYVRHSVCNYLRNTLHLEKPHELLLPQLHPKEFFGCDMFSMLFKQLIIEGTCRPVIDSFDDLNVLVAIDEIQTTFQMRNHFRLPQIIENDRPFFTPLVFFSKQLCSQFLISGTGINFELLNELLKSVTLKTSSKYACRFVPDFHPLSRPQVEAYTRMFLSHWRMQDIDHVVTRLSSSEMCLGRPRFLTYILEAYRKLDDIEAAIDSFCSEAFNPLSQYFPLRFVMTDLSKQKNPLQRICDGETLETKFYQLLLSYMLKGNATLLLKSSSVSADMIRYGIGFCTVENGYITGITLNEWVVFECLRKVLPVSGLVKHFAQNMATCENPQMVVYLVEYLVAFALVANHGAIEDTISAWHLGPAQYLDQNFPRDVCFPDYMCGPDIIYKCLKTKTIYIVQVKFVNKISNQGLIKAWDTTDPEFFYCDGKNHTVLKGYEKRRDELLSELEGTKRQELSLKRMLFVHCDRLPSERNPDVEVVTSKTHPTFFDSLGSQIWPFLDSIREDSS